VIHSVENYEGTVSQFDVKVTGCFRGDGIKRQVSESVFIELTEHIILNRRDEWRQ